MHNRHSYPENRNARARYQPCFRLPYLQLRLGGSGGQERGLSHQHLEENHSDAPPVTELSVPCKTGTHTSQGPLICRPSSVRVMQRKTDLQKACLLARVAQNKDWKGHLWGDDSLPVGGGWSLAFSYFQSLVCDKHRMLL